MKGEGMGGVRERVVVRGRREKGRREGGAGATKGEGMT